MAVFKNILRKVCFWKKTDEQIEVNNDQNIARTLKEYEFYVFKIQNILVWEKPSHSFLWLGIVNLLFWLIVNQEWKLYGICFTFMLITTLHEMWFKRIWPEIRVKRKEDKHGEENRRGSSTGNADADGHPSITMLSDLIQTSSKAVKDLYLWLKTLREQNQGKFCSVMAGVLFPLFITGRMMSGILLSYVLVMSVMILPGIWIHVISEETKVSICNRMESLRSIFNPTGDTSNTEEDDEYMLEESGETIAYLSQIVDSDTNDSFYSKGSATPISFVTDMAMPSHDDISLDSLASFSELDLALENSSPQTVILKDVEDYSDDSSSNDPAIMDFQSGHFNGNESSGDEEENMYAKDLTFTERDCNQVLSSDTQPAGISFSSVFSATTSNLGNIGAVVGQTLLANVVSRAIGYTGENQPKVVKSSPEDQTSTKIAKNDSSNSLSSNEDFELISHDEVS